jgi:hypothetical protein
MDIIFLRMLVIFLLQINELGKQRHQLEKTGRIQTSLFNEEEVKEDLWLGPAGKKMAPGRMLSSSQDVWAGPVHGVPSFDISS